MKKILIVTLFDEYNIGNRLQNYALQKVLENHGYCVTTIDNFYTQKIPCKVRLKYSIKRLLVLGGNKKYSSDCLKYSRLNMRRRAIQKFNKRNISDIIQISNQKAFEIDWSQFDLVVAGSDQIWHKWQESEIELPYYYLQFVPSDKRVAYAASFGFESFPKKDIEQHRIGLQEMRYISCREEVGCELIENLINRRVSRVLDPTLLLSAQEWRLLKNQSRGFGKKYHNYAFVFFLGEITAEYRKFIEETMKENNIDMLIDFNDNQFGVCGPCDFLELIDNAQYIYTDSFHCTVFSAIFDKKFTSFRRVQPGFEKMFGRIEDLLASMDKLSHIYGSTQRTSTNNFDEIYKFSIQYIRKILGESK